MELVTVRAYRDPIDAHVARSILDVEGIPAFVWDDQLISIQWLYSAAIGGAKLKVDRSDLGRALELLGQESSVDLSQRDEDQLPAADGDICPRCRADRVRRSRLFRSTLALSLWSGLPIFLWRKRWVCESCGHSWHAETPPPVIARPETLEAERNVKGDPQTYPGFVPFLIGFIGLAVLCYVQYKIGPR